MGAPKSLITKFVTRQTFDVLMFGYVRAICTYFPTIGQRKAIAMFAKDHNLSIDEYNQESALITYQRMNNELREHNKRENAS